MDWNPKDLEPRRCSRYYSDIGDYVEIMGVDMGEDSPVPFCLKYSFRNLDYGYLDIDDEFISADITHWAELPKLPKWSKNGK